ncbi:hypothetical protein [Croceicoccus gelatinilyticus]|uniref:hypothetical protein n=1 Tax=Croceicoccus gelatinilyticus TaxID=2835536 RepID=UPI001BCCF5BB|nr:hypothetical protein [Croceicoccus gelatinilyticus]MBS7671755.1 hypothetical protein [Croceicoccus gelatinilyticus]
MAISEQQIDQINDEAEALELSYRFLVDQSNDIIIVNDEYEPFYGAPRISSAHVSIGYLIAFDNGVAFGIGVGRSIERNTSKA